MNTHQEHKDKQERFILNGNLWKIMASLSWPAIVAMVLYGFNSVLDGIFVGRFIGAEALAGVSIAYPLSQLSIAVASLIGAGAAAALSIMIGEKDTKGQRKIMGNVHFLIIILSIIYTVLVFIFAEPLIKLMGGTGEALTYGIEYFKICTIGSFFWIVGLAYNLIVRAEGKMKFAAVVMTTGLVVNAVANYLFIIVFKMGVAGAAWGTNIGMLTYSVVGLIYFIKGNVSFDIRYFSIRIDKDIILDIFRLGIPSFITSIMYLIQSIFVFNALATYGTINDVAFYGTVNRIFTFLLTPIMGLMRALQPVLGINYGAKQFKRVIDSTKVFIAGGMILTLPLWVVAMIKPELLLNLMIKDVVFNTSQLGLFRVYMMVLPLMSIIFIALTFFPSINKGGPAALIGIARQVVFYIPVMIFLPKILGVDAVYYGAVSIDIIIVIVVFFMMLRAFKQLRLMK